MRSNGMITYRAEELAQSGRMLTIFALLVDYTGDAALMLQHFHKARAHAQWLLYRFEQSLTNYPDPSDPRHGIIAGGDEGDTFVGFYETYGQARPLLTTTQESTPSGTHSLTLPCLGFPCLRFLCLPFLCLPNGQMRLGHKYSTHANAYRGIEDIGRMWSVVGKSHGRSDVEQHAAELLAAAPRMRQLLQASLHKTIKPTGNPRAPFCVPTSADPPNPPSDPPMGCLGDFRGYPELMYSGALTHEQAAHLFAHLAYGNDSRLVTRPMTLACTGYNNKQVRPAPTTREQYTRAPHASNNLLCCALGSAVPSPPALALPASSRRCLLLSSLRSLPAPRPFPHGSLRIRPTGSPTVCSSTIWSSHFCCTTLECLPTRELPLSWPCHAMPLTLPCHAMPLTLPCHATPLARYTRGTWTTPEATHPDRDIGSTDYVAAGVHTAPTYLKWALVFEEPNNRTVWLAKAMPRDWLAAGAEPVVVSRAPTRYGRISYTLTASATSAAGAEASIAQKAASRLPSVTGGASSYRVHANVSLPATFLGATGPIGGLRLRLRAPVEHAGKLASVTVGGKAWKDFDAKAETVDFTPTALASKALLADMRDVVAVWG